VKIFIRPKFFIHTTAPANMKTVQLATLGLTILFSGISPWVVADPWIDRARSDSSSLCAIVHDQHWTAPTPNTDWKLSHAPITFPIPTDLQPRCLTRPTQPITDCLVLQSAGYTFWTYQDSNGTVLLAYDILGNMARRWELPNLLVVDMRVNPVIDTIDFIGAAGQLASLTWGELSLEPSHNSLPTPPPVPKTPQTIALETPASLIVGASLTLNATGGASENPITLESTTPQSCIVTGNKLTALRAGTCTLVAQQAGNEHYLAADPVEKNLTINAPAPVSTAPSQPCLNVTGNYTTEMGITRAGYCNDYRFNNRGVPCLTVVNGTEIMAGNCEVNQLSPRPYPIKTLDTTGRAEISTSYSPSTPRCDSSMQFTEARLKLPNTLAFACIRYERDAVANSFYYGVALLNNSQILSYKLETTPDRCIGRCPTLP
jgi:hypothetical protein